MLIWKKSSTKYNWLLRKKTAPSKYELEKNKGKRNRESEIFFPKEC